MDICDAAWVTLKTDAGTFKNYAPNFLDGLAALRPYVHEEDIEKDYVQSYSQYPWYYYYSQLKKPKAILEIGVRRGYSIISMCLGHVPSKVALIDSEHDGCSLEDVVQKLKDFKIPYFRTVKNTSQDAFEDYKAETYDLIHIDGEHTVDALKSDLRYSRFLAPDGWIIVDDVHDMPELLATCKEFAQNGWELVEVPTFRGHAVMRRTPDVDRCVMDGGK